MKYPSANNRTNERQKMHRSFLFFERFCGAAAPKLGFNRGAPENDQKKRIKTQKEIAPEENRGENGNGGAAIRLRKRRLCSDWPSEQAKTKPPSPKFKNRGPSSAGSVTKYLARWSKNYEGFAGGSPVIFIGMGDIMARRRSTVVGSGSIPREIVFFRGQGGHGGAFSVPGKTSVWDRNAAIRRERRLSVRLSSRLQGRCGRPPVLI